MQENTLRSAPAVPGLTLTEPLAPGHEQILCGEALALVESLARRFEPRRQALLAARREQAAARRAGERPDFLAATRHIRESEWRVAPIPADLQDRRVEITGPVDRKMVINALNSGARMFMAVFEDATAPTWHNLIDGQRNLRDAMRGDIEYTAPGGKHYRLGPEPATLLVRPRGWHLPEKHVLLEGEPIGGALLDFALYAFHNGATARARGTGLYYYLPKLESWHEAELWNAVIDATEDHLGLPRGTVRVTVLIETLPAAFQMDEILHALREHIVGLNCGRWDYIFSFIKCFHHDAGCLLPDREQVTMTAPFLRAYSQLLIRTCHRRGAFAMGGMAAQIPIRDDAAAHEAAMQKVRADKEREAGDGHDGTWVAHPGLVPIAQAVFDAHMPGPNQIERLRDDVSVTAADLLAVPGGTITERGVRGNLRAALGYLEAWLGGQGCVPLNHLMEDAATAEIARAQLWQWTHHDARLDDGRPVSLPLVQAWLREECAALSDAGGAAQPPGRAGPGAVGGRHAQAADLLEQTLLDDEFADFITLAAYPFI